MRLKALQHDAHALRVEIHGTEETFANMVRRALTDVLIPATVAVTFQKNTSCFPDETLAHRIGLIPLRSAFAEHRPATISAKGPCLVTAAHILAEDVDVPHPDLLVVCLADGEELRCTLDIALQTGKDHARHSAAVAPRAVRRHEGMQRQLGISEDVPLHTALPVECFCDETAYGTARCGECTGRKRSLVDKHAPEVFIIEFETTGALSPLELFRRALESARDAAAHAQKQLDI